jgi:hypothetical protein
VDQDPVDDLDVFVAQDVKARNVEFGVHLKVVQAAIAVNGVVVPRKDKRGTGRGHVSEGTGGVDQGGAVRGLLIEEVPQDEDRTGPHLAGVVADLTHHVHHVLQSVAGHVPVVDTGEGEAGVRVQVRDEQGAHGTTPPRPGGRTGPELP